MVFFLSPSGAVKEREMAIPVAAQPLCSALLPTCDGMVQDGVTQRPLHRLRSCSCCLLAIGHLQLCSMLAQLRPRLRQKQRDKRASS